MPAGRPAHKRNRVLRMIEDGSLELMAMGADTEKELYTKLEISAHQWIQMKKEIPQLQQLMIRTMYESELQIKGANKKRALGYDYEETEDSIVVDKNGREHPVTKIMKRHCPPDTNAQKLYMANLKRRATNAGVDLNWTNSTETVEIKADGAVSLVLDDAIKSVLKELESDR